MNVPAFSLSNYFYQKQVISYQNSRGFLSSSSSYILSLIHAAAIPIFIGIDIVGNMSLFLTKSIYILVKKSPPSLSIRKYQ